MTQPPPATIGGKPIAYTATAGTLTIRDDEGKPTASMFYVAYTTGDPHRPVTFLYNGGPGSSTLWLHMGSLAPVRVRTDSPQPTHNAPYDMVNNDDSLLDKSDLVFLDAIGAGFSRPLGDTKLAAFWGTDQDIDAFARGIERWLTINGRWNAPKFMFGESYGTTRSAGLSYRLQHDGVQLNGVVLLSSILNYGRRQPGLRPGDDQLPAQLRRRGRLPPPAGRASRPTCQPSCKEVRDWARGPYAMALAKGQDLGDAERQRRSPRSWPAISACRPDYILASDLRIDARPLPQGAAARPAPDARPLRRPLHRQGRRRRRRVAGVRPLGHRHHRRLRRRLPRLSDPRPRLPDRAHLPADLLSRRRAMGLQPQGRRPRRRGRRVNQADVALDLSQAMRENPHLLLYSLNGIYDLATPFFGTEYDLGHMQLDPAACAAMCASPTTPLATWST